MARPTPWLPHVPQILKSVNSSVRSHFDRKAIEEIFGVPSASAGRVMKMMPRTDALGTSHLVEKATLVRFLEQLSEAGDSSSELAKQRQAPAKISRRSPRTLIHKDLVSDGQLIALPSNVKLERGRLEIEFGSVLELCENLAMVAGSIANEEEAFVEAYEPIQPPSPEQVKAAEDRVAIQKLFEGLRATYERDSKQAPLRTPSRDTKFETHAITHE